MIFGSLCSPRDLNLKLSSLLSRLKYVTGLFKLAGLCYVGFDILFTVDVIDLDNILRLATCICGVELDPTAPALLLSRHALLVCSRSCLARVPSL